MSREFHPCDLICTGYAGENGTAVLCSENEEKLKKRFSAAFLKPVRNLKKTEFPDSLKNTLQNEGVLLIPCTDTGIYGALWTLFTETGTGFSVRQRDIPVRQETIEICNETDEDPYLLDSEGTYLLACPEEKRSGVERLLSDEGIKAFHIGQTISGKQKMIFREDGEFRYLERPKKHKGSKENGQ